MIQFDAAPPVPYDYPRLTVLTDTETRTAAQYGYVADGVSPESSICRAGVDNCLEQRADDDMRDWRTRMYVAWFCYVFENFERIRRPLYAIEELILEFKGQSVLDTPQCSLPQMYAGAGGWELTGEELVRQKKLLQAHYDIALGLLDAWMFTHQDH